MSKVETPRYTVLEEFGAIEIRIYPRMVVAECDVQGERREAIRQGFRILAGYIFGNNGLKKKIAMTAPVTQKPHEKNAEGTWTVRFGMPAIYENSKSLPIPNDTRVRLVQTEEKKWIAIRFSGMVSSTNISRNYEKLTNFIKEKGFKTTGNPTYAFYTHSSSRIVFFAAQKARA